MSTVSNKLEESLGGPDEWCHEYTTGGILYRLCSNDVEIEVSAGEIIGTAGEHHDQLDFGAYDMRTEPLQYANPDRFYKQLLHTVCALDYFTPELKEKLKAKLGDFQNQRTIEPVCGEVEQDEPGTAQGVWFVEDAESDPSEDEQLALAHDNINPTTPVFSVGTSMEKSGLGCGLYYFTKSDSGFVNRDFKDVIPDNMYCYEVTKRFENTVFSTIILQLTSSTTLRMERQDPTNCGSGPWSFGSTYTDFER
jgi:hypothetical protein